MFVSYEKIVVLSTQSEFQKKNKLRQTGFKVFFALRSSSGEAVKFNY